eukprot:GSChrysophyteH1.ASY1.ANO1.2265.1 assembled CDS
MSPTAAPTVVPTTAVPTTVAPTTVAPTTAAPTMSPTVAPTVAPTTAAPTTAPTTASPTISYGDYYDYGYLKLYSASNTQSASDPETPKAQIYISAGDEMYLTGCGCTGDQLLRFYKYDGTAWDKSTSETLDDNTQCDGSSLCSYGRISCTSPTWTHSTYGPMCPFLVYMGCYEDGACSGQVKVWIRENSKSYVPPTYMGVRGETFEPTAA